MVVVKITEDNFINIDPSILLDAKRYPQMEDMVVSIDAAFTPDYSKKYALLMQAKLAPVIDAMPADLQAKYFRLLKVLLLQSLLTMSDQEKERFFKETILETFSADYTNVRLWIELVFRSSYAAPDIIEKYRQLFLKGLQENIQALGSQVIKVGGEETPRPPTVRNWLLDYTRLSKTVDNRPRGRIEEGKYMMASADVAKLALPDKNILLKLIEFFDWLSFGDLRFDASFPESKAVKERILEENQYSPGIPSDLIALINRRRQGTANSVEFAVQSRIPPRAPLAALQPVSQAPQKPSVFTYSQAASQQNRAAPVSKPMDGAVSRPPAGGAFTRENAESAKQTGARLPRELTEEVESTPSQKSRSFSASQLSRVSLSQAVANADQESLQSNGNLRVGKQPPVPVPPKPIDPGAKPKTVNFSASTPTKPAGIQAGMYAPVPAKPAPSPVIKFASRESVPRPVFEMSKPQPTVAPSGAQIPPSRPAPLIDLLENRNQDMVHSAAGQVVDLTRRPVLYIEAIKQPEALSKIELKDFLPEEFDSKLSQIKQKVVDLSKEFQIPIKKVTEQFYKSPLYELYVAMAVAVTNDAGSTDQGETIARVAKNYQSAGKDVLSRDQFLSMGRFKKELTELEESI
ncbi:MAG: hypothetical protein Q8N81_05210 [bacterium]|nr:hypothetical protein [bacterium]